MKSAMVESDGGQNALWKLVVVSAFQQKGDVENERTEFVGKRGQSTSRRIAKAEDGAVHLDGVLRPVQPPGFGDERGFVVIRSNEVGQLLRIFDSCDDLETAPKFWRLSGFEGTSLNEFFEQPRRFVFVPLVVSFAHYHDRVSRSIGFGPRSSERTRRIGQLRVDDEISRQRVFVLLSQIFDVPSPDQIFLPPRSLQHVDADRTIQRSRRRPFFSVLLVPHAAHLELIDASLAPTSSRASARQSPELRLLFRFLLLDLFVLRRCRRTRRRLGSRRLSAAKALRREGNHLLVFLKRGCEG